MPGRNGRNSQKKGYFKPNMVIMLGFSKNNMGLRIEMDMLKSKVWNGNARSVAARPGMLGGGHFVVFNL
jgi:hypothetical protein